MPNNLIFAPMRWTGLALLLTILVFSGTGCDKNEPVPAYLSIDSASFNPGPAEGNKIQQIVAVRCAVNGKTLGVFELPAKIPVLSTGKFKVQLLPYVRINGSRQKHEWFSVCKSIDTVLTFSASKVVKLSNVVFSYRSSIQLKWLEDFEDNNSTLIKVNIPQGDTAGITTVPFDLEGRYKSNTHAYTVTMKASDTLKVFDLRSFDQFTNFPSEVADIYLEIDVNTPVELQLALNRRKPGQSNEYVPYLQINPTDGIWKRFYVNLKYEIASNDPATEYIIILSGTKPEELKSEARVHIDNIRLVYTN